MTDQDIKLPGYTLLADMPHLKDVRLLADTNLTTHCSNGTTLDKCPQSQEVITQISEAVGVVLGAVMVHQLTTQQRSQTPHSSAMPARQQARALRPQYSFSSVK